MDPSTLDNAVWHSLTGAHQMFAERTGGAGRYDPNVSVFAAVDEFDDASWRDLAALVGPGGTAVLFRADIPETPPTLEHLGGGVGHQMVLRNLAPVDVPAVRVLGLTDAEEMQALVKLTEPGPFRPRTVELGTYFGVFHEGALVAMAGERLRVPGYTEISAVCTHPNHRGQGLAAGLTAHVARGILARGDTPFLHHAADNDPARRVYDALGFEFRREVGIAVVGMP